MILAALTLIALLVMKVAKMILLAILFVTGPLVIALYPVPETSHLVKGWATALGSIVLIPVGWCVIFATAGALMGDRESYKTAGTLKGHFGEDLLAATTGFLTFYMAYKWPLIVLSQVRGLASNPVDAKILAII